MKQIDLIRFDHFAKEFSETEIKYNKTGSISASGYKILLSLLSIWEYAVDTHDLLLIIVSLFIISLKFSLYQREIHFLIFLHRI